MSSVVMVPKFLLMDKFREKATILNSVSMCVRGSYELLDFRVGESDNRVACPLYTCLVSDRGREHSACEVHRPKAS